MFRGDVERLEVVELVLPQDQRQGMKVPAADWIGDEGDVDPLGIAERGMSFRFQRALALRDPAEDVVFELIRLCAGGGPFGGRQASQLSQDAGELALLPQQADPQVFEGFVVGRRIDTLTRAGPELLEFADDSLLHTGFTSEPAIER